MLELSRLNQNLQAPCPLPNRINITDRWELNPYLYQAVQKCLEEVAVCFGEAAANLQIVSVEYIENLCLPKQSIKKIHFLLQAYCRLGLFQWERANYVNTQPTNQLKQIEIKNSFTEESFKEEVKNLQGDFSISPFDPTWEFDAIAKIENGHPILIVKKFIGNANAQFESLFKSVPIKKIIWQARDDYFDSDDKTLYSELINIVPRAKSLQSLAIETPFEADVLKKLLNNLLRSPALVELILKGQDLNHDHCRLISQIAINVSTVQQLNLSNCKIDPKGAALFQKVREIRPDLLFDEQTSLKVITPLQFRFPVPYSVEFLKTPTDLTNTWDQVPLVDYLVANVLSEFCKTCNGARSIVKIKSVNLLENNLFVENSVRKMVCELWFKFKEKDYFITHSAYCLDKKQSDKKLAHENLFITETMDNFENLKLIEECPVNLSSICKRLKNNLNARSLVLRNTDDTGDEIWLELAHCISSMTQLRYLHISGHQFTSAQIYALSNGLKNHPSLEVVYSDNHIYQSSSECTGKSALALISALKTIPRLKAFSISGLINEKSMMDKFFVHIISKEAFQTYYEILDLVESNPRICLFEFNQDYMFIKHFETFYNKVHSRMELLKERQKITSQLQEFNDWHSLHVHYTKKDQLPNHVAGNFLLVEAQEIVNNNFGQTHIVN